MEEWIFKMWYMQTKGVLFSHKDEWNYGGHKLNGTGNHNLKLNKAD
jgi:hypothetical protein